MSSRSLAFDENVRHYLAERIYTTTIIAVSLLTTEQSRIDDTKINVPPYQQKVLSHLPSDVHPIILGIYTRVCNTAKIARKCLWQL